MLDASFLEADRWGRMPIDVLHSVYTDGVVAPLAMVPSEIYQPASRVPTHLLCKTSDSEKRLAGLLQTRLSGSGRWGRVYEVVGHGSLVGVVVQLEDNAFCGAHVQPDVVHLVSCVEELPDDSIVKDVYLGKTVRLFSIGPIDENKRPHDMMLTAKARWFRHRHNPKFLGFSKEDKL